ncbi:alpha-1,3-arabinosyltransferase XAT2-like [Zingiber officinale]|uniref:Glycosyltransferase 61 catalytic domain-containing protein n=1 Tax=Zingiber officinale TaxID=94328 RepID=A0A8J5KFH8_ZINOF|nr:alpha-1,3-arabinosyltransferase XAT2-like [Zingiber officinale]KAG6479159.1 hypothetical protein ZIOFF_062620 [Zingiber officinale]
MANHTNHHRHSSIGWVAIAGFFFLSMVLLLLSTSYASSFPGFGFWLSTDSVDSPTRAEIGEETTKKEQPLCDLTLRRTEICDMAGDVRVHGNSSTVLFVTASGSQESYKIKPHPRKGDGAAMASVSEVTVKSSSQRDAPRCTVTSRVPAVIFSNGGYMFNFFHDISDALIPLFLSSREFDGEVQFLVRDMLPWWVEKFEPLLKGLSRYDLIDLNGDREVRCFSRVIVGLQYHGDLYIDPDLAGGITMLDYGRYLRKSLGLKRETAVKLRTAEKKEKPRVLIINRKGTRKFTNVGEIARMAEMSGFEAVVSEMQSNATLAEVALEVNSADVLVGVHGAGMTNLVFMPAGGVLVQIVPLGRMEDVCWINYGAAAVRMRLNYVQYSVRAPESNLIDEFPKDDPVILDPKAVFEKQGSGTWVSLYMHRQTVKLDVERFRSVLWHAREIFRQPWN